MTMLGRKKSSERISDFFHRAFRPLFSWEHLCLPLPNNIWTSLILICLLSHPHFPVRNSLLHTDFLQLYEVGEALLNDGMALVLFTTLTSSELSTPGEIAIYFVRVIFFSPLVGVTLGLGDRLSKHYLRYSPECDRS
jgi:hypothetical protein